MSGPAPLPPGALTLGLVVHPTRQVTDSVRRLTRWARARGDAVVARHGDRDRVGADVRTVSDDEFVATVDAIVSLGGDGTMLGAMRLVAGRPVPVLGVNHGNVGFLIELAPGDLDLALNRLCAGDFSVEPHLGLQVLGVAGNDLVGQPPMAFNDVVLTRRDLRSAASIDLGVNGEQYGYYRADALVIATPTGSTAYNYAAGGPVVSPSAPAVVITPIAPMAGISRSVVMGPDDEIVLRVDPDGDRVEADVDGVPAGRVEPGRSVAIRPVREAARVVRLDSATHARRSGVRLSLLDLPLRPDQLRELIPAELRVPHW